ncbi:MAG: O-antigen ligase family protein [Rhizobiaceae bacterium]|nr:O-antigen ligase family protein [Rhizobiaceae bacterium]
MPALDRAAVNAKTISLVASFAIGLGVFLSGFVFREPAPYELYMAALIGVWFLFGLRLSATIMPLLVLLLLFNIGGMISVTQKHLYQDGPLYVAVSLFLALSAVFYAAVVEADYRRLDTMIKAYLAAAFLTALLGIAAYFGALNVGYFVRYGRAAGGFEDPNVFGPFLVLPALYLIYQVLTGPVGRILAAAVPLAVIAVGLLLSFSRGAWGLMAFSTLALVLMLLIKHRSGMVRMRIILMSVVALALLAVTVVAALQIPQVAELFQSRAHLTQDYDTAQFGRFARYRLGFIMAMEHPLGIGPLEFGLIFGEDTHDIWLKALMDYGWLGFATYLTLIVMTLAAGFRILLRERPWQAVFMCAYITLLGHVLLGTIIDTDHWRHFYMLVGIVWGCIALEARHQRALANAPHPHLQNAA